MFNYINLNIEKNKSPSLLSLPKRKGAVLHCNDKLRFYHFNYNTIPNMKIHFDLLGLCDGKSSASGGEI
jgi:hypothetical protein